MSRAFERDFLGAWSGPAQPGTVSRLREGVGRAATAAGFSGEALDGIRSCVSESVTNAVVHAFRDGRAPGTVYVSVQMDDCEFVVKVIDDGVGFRPRTDSPGLGLGMPMILALTTSTSVVAAPGGGTELCMGFALPAVA